MRGPRCRGKWPRVDAGEEALGFIEPAGEEKMSRLQVPRESGIDPVTMRFECCSRLRQRLRGPAQVA